MSKEIILFVIDATFDSLEAYMMTKPLLRFLVPLVHQLHQYARDRVNDILKRSNVALKEAGIRAKFDKE